MRILGISAYYHDAAACLIVAGKIEAAAQEERFTRLKHDSSFPSNAIKFCLANSGIQPSDLDYVVFYDKPFPKFERILESYFEFAPKGFTSFVTSMPSWLTGKLFQKSQILSHLRKKIDGNVNWSKKLLFSDHHLSHAASAFFPSPFATAAILTMDGVGEWATTSVALGKENAIEVFKEINFPHSLGLLYSAFTYYLGFRVNSGEYKVMGLAPFGKPSYVRLIKENLIDIKDDGSFALNMEFFDFCTGLKMTNHKFHALFGGAPRVPESALSERHLDLAASIQSVAEEVLLGIGRWIARETGEKNLCLAGGVALNCVANGKLARAGVFDRVWIQPAAGDSGGAIGAALAAFHLMLDSKRTYVQPDGMRGSFLGPEFSQSEIEEQLLEAGAIFEVLSNEDRIEITARCLVLGLAVGWMNGRMEFGPRSLGGRSIIADPRSPEMQKKLNLKIKFRESFRPFAPSILEEDCAEWFSLKGTSPYMLLVSEILEKHRLFATENLPVAEGLAKQNNRLTTVPAVTHVDYSARVQTVSKETNEDFYNLILKFKELTGCPILVNTSFNVRGEPIVCSPRDAFDCFMGTNLDILVIGKCFLRKDSQNKALASKYYFKYQPD